MNRLLAFILIGLLQSSVCWNQTVLIPNNGIWKFLDNNTRPANWFESSFNDVAWNQGPAELGYGDGGEATVVSFGPNSTNKYITTYFRKNFQVTGLNNFSTFTINLVRDDGAVVYVNGREVYRNNLPAGIIQHSTLAIAAIGNADETTPVSTTLCSSFFLEGENVIAVEMHQNLATSSDLSFQLELIGNPIVGGTPSITRGPYMQMGNANELTIRWRTNIATNSRVEAGIEFGSNNFRVDSLCYTTEHEVRLSGLLPDTKYYYRVGNTNVMLQGDSNNFFRTMPLPGTNRKIGILAIGDGGGQNLTYQTQAFAQYRAMLAANNIEAADAVILLGDNAYENGTDNEFQTKFFNPLAPIWKNHKLYPSPGNHDYAQSAARQDDHNIPYYSMFTLPVNGECGGVASGNEAFFSFDIGDVHFISLDSYGEESNKRMSDTTGAQVLWLKNDLAANTKKWVIVYFHHPPYTMGGHNSDTETELAAIRNNLNRVLERYGVDMVICGHSHNYERSKLIRGHFGNELTYSESTHAVSTSSGMYNSVASCPYIVSSDTGRHGTLYVIAGSFGASGGIAAGYPHNAMPYSINDGGFLWLDIEQNRLDAKFVRRNGETWDRFTIMQDVNKTVTYNIAPGDEITLTANWPGQYNWSTGANTRSITVSPTGANNSYSVSDQFNCITDHFTVNATCGINTWVGTKNNAWENPLNWSCGTIPGPNSEVVINAGTFYSPTVNAHVSIKKLTVQSGAFVTVTSGYRINIWGE